MGWCKRFREQVKEEYNIEFLPYKKKWYFNTCDDDQFSIEIDYCPFCGATLSNDGL